MAEKKRFVFAERKRALQMAATCGLSVIEEKKELRGYQIYIVEQWVCDRKTPSNVVKVFTGDENHVIQVAVIAISTAELQHPRPQIQIFLNLGAHLKSKPTPLGEILLTNPGELPFDTDMLLVPDGDYDKWIKQAYVNINLRRTNCTGRSSLNLKPPNPASEEKFRSLYKIADTVDFEDAVINLVSLVQIALYLFKLLDKDYIDGLICNETTNAFWIFYTKYDPIKTTEFTLKEPWMEPHLLAAIISKLLMCKNKLQDYNFTTVKDPFLDYDAFRFDISDYQRYKNIRATKFIDLDTLAKLNEHTFSQLKVTKVIKSKLDDISGTTNSPLFNETSDPEVFRHHATIESLRAIWRPKSKGGGNSSNTSSGNILYVNSNNSHTEQQQYQQQQNERMHMFKRTTRTGGAAVDMLSRVAGSLPWINTDSSNKKDTSSNSSRSPTSSQIHENISSSILSPKTSYLENNSNFSYTSSANSSGKSSSIQQEEEFNIASRITTPSRKHSPLAIPTSSTTSLVNNSNHSTKMTGMDIPNTNMKHNISSDQFDQNIPSQPSSSASPSTAHLKSAPKVHVSKSSDTTQSVNSPGPSSTPSSTSTKNASASSEGDFVPYVMPTKLAQPSLRHARSISDTALLDSLFVEALDSDNKIESLHAAFDKYHSQNDQQHKRSQTLAALLPPPLPKLESVIDESEVEDRPVATMSVQSYMMYERLCRQQIELQRTYDEVKAIADLYEKTAAQLKETYERRAAAFSALQKDSRKVMNEQGEIERRLKEVEDNSAKLHYELKVLNDKLKDIEDNVGTFYGKVGLLERKMDDSQQSITTMLIVGNYFNHYWLKVREWVHWLTTTTTTPTINQPSEIQN